MTAPSDRDRDPGNVGDKCWADITRGIPCNSPVPHAGSGLCHEHETLLRQWPPLPERARVLT